MYETNNKLPAYFVDLIRDCRYFQRRPTTKSFPRDRPSSQSDTINIRRAYRRTRSDIKRKVGVPNSLVVATIRNGRVACPTASDFPVSFRIWLHLSDLSSEGKTIIITTHYIEEARRAHTVGMMRIGMILSEDAPESLMKCYGCSSLEDVFLKLCIIDTSKVIQVNYLSSLRRSTVDSRTRTNRFLICITRCYDTKSNTPLYYYLFDITVSFRKLRCPSTTVYKKNCYL